jgi:hypothetical protein
VIKHYEEGETAAMISRAVNLGESTLRNIRDNAEKIKGSIKAGTPLSSHKSSYNRARIMEKIEKILTTWLQDQHRRNVPLSQAIVCAKARSIFNDLNAGDSDAKRFTASVGWISNFKARHGFKNVKMSGESASADFEATEKFPEELRDIIEHGGYTAKQVFNVDETGLY